MAECVTVAAPPTTLTSCTRTSVIAECVLVVVAAVVVVAAAKTAAVASAVTAAITVMETTPLPPPPLPPTGTEAAIAGTQISSRVSAAVGATTPAAEPRPVEVEFRNSRASRRVSLAILHLLLHHQEGRSL